MSDTQEKSFFGKILEDTTRLWHQLVPVEVDTFLNRVLNGPESSRTEYVKIEIHKRKEHDELCYAVIYQAVNDRESVMLYSSEVFSCHECKDAYLQAEGKIPEQVEETVWKRTLSKVNEVRDRLEDAGMPVEVHKPESE